MQGSRAIKRDADEMARRRNQGFQEVSPFVAPFENRNVKDYLMQLRKNG
jgi:hypothetical protein